MLKRKDGGVSIVLVIVMFIGVIIISGTIDLISKQYVFNEIRSIMDMSGVSALSSGVDMTDIRVEEFVINESFVRTEFKKMVAGAIRTNRTITHFSITDGDIKVDIFRGNWGLGTQMRVRGQARLDAVAKVRIRSSSFIDKLPGVQETYYNSLSQEFFTVQYLGTLENGEVELLIRSVTRVVYR